MGDPRRFDLFADLITQRFPDSTTPIADVAAGKGHLKAALYLRNYRSVTCWDRRKKLAKPRPGQRYQLFDYRNAPRGYRLVIGMHPDEATDQIILYSIKHRVPFIVCPCCVKPSGSSYQGSGTFRSWENHLTDLARKGGFEVDRANLEMDGKNLVLIGCPKKRG